MEGTEQEALPQSDLQPTTDGPQSQESDATAETEIELGEDEPLEDAWPFDAGQVSVYSDRLTMALLAERLKHGEIELSPDYQRGEVWTPKKKSLLIESLLIRVPLPTFYFDIESEAKWEVVDGLQRLSAIRDFVVLGQLQQLDEGQRAEYLELMGLSESATPMRLIGLEYLGRELDGRTFSEMSRVYQRRLLEATVSVNYIDKPTPKSLKINVFKRINTGGEGLSAQEVRHAVWGGPQVNGMLRNLADSRPFAFATGGRISDKRMGRRETVLRALAFMVTPYTEYPGLPVSGSGLEHISTFDEFLGHAMFFIENSDQAFRDHLARRCVQGMERSRELFGINAYRKGAGYPVNKALFEMLTVELSEDRGFEWMQSSESRELCLEKFKSLLQHPTFLNLISQGTGKAANVRERFGLVRAVLEEMEQC